MTCCVAALCDKNKSIVLISDKMLGTGMIESEPNITKMVSLHKNWRAMFAGNDIVQVSPIVDAIRAKLRGITAPTLKQMTEAVYASYSEERSSQSEAMYLAPRGWTLKQFNSSKASILPEATREDLLTNISSVEVEVSLLVAGFDNRGIGHIFSVDDSIYQQRGKPRIQDLPGYHAIGSGGDAAMYMMAYRAYSPVMPLRIALYYAVEGKYFGEKSGGVGTKTDAVILRSGQRPFKLTTKALEETLFDLCMKLEPRPVRNKECDALNELSGAYFDRIPKLHAKKVGDEWIIEPVRQSRTRKSKGQQ